MKHAERTKRFWRRSLVWVIPAIIVLLVAWVAWEVRSENERTESLMRYAVSVGGQVNTDVEVPAWLEAVEAVLKFIPALPSTWLSDVEAEFCQMRTSISFRDNTLIDDAGLAHLRDSPMLVRLDLAGTGVTDAGLAHLTGLTNLDALDLTSTQVTDAGLVHLAGLTGLKEIDLDHTQVSDAGLTHLRGLTNLGWLDLRGTQVSDAGVKDLEQSHPGIVILFPQPAAPQR